MRRRELEASEQSAPPLTGLRRTPRHVLLLLPGIVALLAYGLFVDQYFVSEDFAILAVLMSDGAAGRVLRMFTGTWLGIDFVLFYRPLSTAMLWIESLAFGTWSPGYKIVHVLVHAGNATLVGCATRTLLQQLEPRSQAAVAGIDGRARIALVATVVATLWAIYPLHPNAVLFIGSFASLFGASWQLIAWLLWLRWRADATRGDASAWLALGSLAAALLSYEAAFAAPIVIVAMEVLLPGGPRPRRARWALLAGVAIVAAAGFGLRAVSVGGELGGYDGFRDRLSTLGPMLTNWIVNWWNLFLPLREGSGWPFSDVWVGLLWVGGLTAVLWSARRRGDRRPLRLFLIASFGVAVTQLPFAFNRVVPGNGRYWYLTSWFALLAVAALVAVARRAGSRRLGAVLTVGAIVTWGPSLWRVQGLQQRAADISEAIQREASSVRTSADETVVVVGVPDFLYLRQSTPAAQIYHWGFANALGPPFADRAVDLFRWPTSAGEVGLGLREASNLRLLRWDDESGRLEAVHLEPERRDQRPGPRPGIGWTGGTPSDGVDPGRTLTFRADQIDNLTVYFLAGGRLHFQPVFSESQLELDVPFLESMSRLVDGMALVWLEGTGANGRFASPVVRVTL